MTNSEWLFTLPLEELCAWFDSEHVEAPNGTADRLSGALDAKMSELAEERDMLEAECDELARMLSECTVKRVAAQADAERYRELLGLAVDNAHATVVLLDGEAVG